MLGNDDALSSTWLPTRWSNPTILLLRSGNRTGNGNRGTDPPTGKIIFGMRTHQNCADHRPAAENSADH